MHNYVKCRKYETCANAQVSYFIHFTSVNTLLKQSKSVEKKKKKKNLNRLLAILENGKVYANFKFTIVYLHNFVRKLPMF